MIYRQVPPVGSFKREERKQIMLETIVKRDGRIVPFELSKIADAVFKAAQATGGRDYDTAMSVAKEVERYLEETLHCIQPSVEEIQDAVEKVLVERDMPAQPRNISFIVPTAPGCGR